MSGASVPLAERLSGGFWSRVPIVLQSEAAECGLACMAMVSGFHGRLTGIAGIMLDGPSALRTYLIRNFITEGFKFEELMADDEACEAFVRKAAIGVWHASCSCRMGADGDPMAVTDSQGRVRGIEGLRVCDSSIMPHLVSSNTNAPTLMIGERAADLIRGVVPQQAAAPEKLQAV